MSEKLIHVDDLSVTYGPIEALRNLNLDIYEGDFLGIIGPNGGGKSTLLKSILNLVTIAKGKVYYPNFPLKKSKIRMGYVPQITEMNRQFPITVFEVVLSGKLSPEIKPFFRYSEKDKEATLDILDKVGIKNLANRQISELSGGEFQKMLIARALTLNPQILFLDEPTAMIDNASQKQIFHLLKRLSQEMTIVLVTHHAQMVLRMLTRLVYLDKNVIAEGDPQDVYAYMYSRQPAREVRMRAREFHEEDSAK